MEGFVLDTLPAIPNANVFQQKQADRSCYANRLNDGDGG